MPIKCLFVLSTFIRIRNPLIGVSREQLFADVDAFAVENGLTDIQDLLRKGALLAQNPAGYENIDGITEEERKELHLEVTKRWHHPKLLYFTIILNSIAAAIQGWDQTGENIHPGGGSGTTTDPARFERSQLVFPSGSWADQP